MHFIWKGIWNETVQCRYDFPLEEHADKVSKSLIALDVKAVANVITACKSFRLINIWAYTSPFLEKTQVKRPLYMSGSLIRLEKWSFPIRKSKDVWNC